MRLLNKYTLNFEWFMDESIPPYLILSHRWYGAETTLQEFAELRHLPIHEQNPGVKKVIQFCQYAESHEAHHVWIDTCCIDKSSSTELQEAINSMYKWYANAESSVVYLEDVATPNDGPLAEEDSASDLEQLLKQSAWFTRGWTLQELLAPRRQVFVDCNWKLIGDREVLAEMIAKITQIRPSFYGSQSEILSATVAERMSWLSDRRTSRVEDLAYCMLGILNVNLTMLYGEGSKAFVRLQKELIQETDDETIFIWQPTHPDHLENPTILAPHPSCFSICRNSVIERDMYFDRNPYRITNRGLEIEHCASRESQFSDSVLLPLNVKFNGQRVGIDLHRRNGGNNKQHLANTQWERLYSDDGIRTFDERSVRKPVSSWGQFLDHSERLLHAGKPGFGAPTPLGGNNGLHSIRAMQAFKGEAMRFNVFIK